MMEELVQMISEMGIPFAYDHFAEGESPDPPFLCYLIPGSDNFAADGKVYHKVGQVHIELYTDSKDPAVEEKVIAVLDSYGIFMTRRKHGSTAKSCMRSCSRLRFLCESEDTRYG